MITTLLAAINGEELIRQLLFMLVIGICVLLIWAAGRYVIKNVSVAEGPSPSLLKGWNILFVLIGLIVAINVLLNLIGKPLIKL